MPFPATAAPGVLNKEIELWFRSSLVRLQEYRCFTERGPA
jgi:hypothetical protein